MESVPEVRFWCLLKDAGLALPKVQRRIGDYRVDFFWPEQRLVVEIDSYSEHGSTPKAYEETLNRATALRGLGLQWLPITPNALRDSPQRALAAVRASLRLAG